MHLELSEDVNVGEGASESAHFYRFGRLRGSAIVDERTGRVKEYKLPLIDINNSQYVGRIQVGSPKKGTPQQEFDVIFDTGSSNLWLNSDSCQSEGCLVHRRFHPRKSKTYKKLPIEMSVQFGTGSIEGFLAQDTFTLGPVRVHGQTFGQIKRSTGSVFVTGKFDGILGLSFPSLSAHAYTPVFDSIIKQKLLTNNMFSFYYVNAHKYTCAQNESTARGLCGSNKSCIVRVISLLSLLFPLTSLLLLCVLSFCFSSVHLLCFVSLSSPSRTVRSC